MSIVKNNHFVSKYLVKDWERSPGKLTIFRYNSGKFTEEDTESLFAKQGIFSQEQELFFNKYIETISRQELSTVDQNNYRAKKWKNYRALVLLLWDLIGRHSAALKGENTAVDFFTGLDEQGLDALAVTILQHFSLQVATVPGNGRLFFPSNILLFFCDPTTGECNFGVPFSGTQILFSVKHGSDMNQLNMLCQNHTFINLSAGNDATEFVLIHKDIDIGDRLKNKLYELREANQTYTSNISQFLAKIREMKTLVGL